MVLNSMDHMSEYGDACPSLRSGDILVNIETTGLRPSSCFIFMAGWALLGDDPATDCRTLLAEGRRDEEEMLRSLRDAIAASRRLVLFGAYSFVLRFLSERWMNYDDGEFLPEGTEVLCLQKALSRWKDALDLRSLRKYDLEEKLGFCRNDRISGEELIRVYSEWEKERSEACCGRLLAHSAEDLRSLAFLSRLLVFREFTKDPEGTLEEMQLLDSGVLSLKLSCNRTFPCSAAWDNGFASVNLSGSTAALRVPCYRGTLKYFLPGKVSDYYYLPDEDCAVHRSVARFVDRDHRVKAVPATCYVRREGIFLPLPEKSPYSEKYPVFTPEYRSHCLYAEFDAEKWCGDQAVPHLYIRSVLQ